jgi:hypothetical protein
MFRKYAFKDYEKRVEWPGLYHEKALPRFRVGLAQRPGRRVSARVFTGMNPTLSDPTQLQFDSDFECGNLDIAVKVGPSEYDLFLRVDTNTRGHCNWFFFVVRNTRRGILRLNICNLCKRDSLFAHGMVPLVFSKLQARLGWQPSCKVEEFGPDRMRY